MKILDQIYVQLEGIIIEEERRRIVARVHEIRKLLRARLEGRADARASLSTQPARGKSFAEKVMDEADKVELDLKYQKKKVQNLIEGHQERYELCCAVWISLGGPRHRRDVLNLTRWLISTQVL